MLVAHQDSDLACAVPSTSSITLRERDDAEDISARSTGTLDTAPDVMIRIDPGRSAFILTLSLHIGSQAGGDEPVPPSEAITAAASVEQTLSSSRASKTTDSWGAGTSAPAIAKLTERRRMGRGVEACGSAADHLCNPRISARNGGLYRTGGGVLVL
jgi:hypothetical protein